jgi:hypothetical protein
MMQYNGIDKTTMTAQLLSTNEVFCKDCGWPIIDMCCNVSKLPYSEWDWWMYCSNPTCKNHKGEGIAQNDCSFATYPI